MSETRCPRCGSPERAVRACVRDYEHDPHLVMLSSQHCDGSPYRTTTATERYLDMLESMEPDAVLQQRIDNLRAAPTREAE